MKAYLIDILNHVYKPIDLIEHNKTDTEQLHQIYSLLNCKVIDIVQRFIGDEVFSFIVDDNYLMTHRQHYDFSYIDKNCSCSLFGNLLITRPANIDGDLVSLSDDDCIFISNHLRTITTRFGKRQIVTEF